MDLWARQRILQEVGDDGQQKLAAASVQVSGSGRAAAVCTDYLRRAGVSNIAVDSSADEPPFAYSELFRHAASRELGAGAWHALNIIRQVLGT